SNDFNSGRSLGQFQNDVSALMAQVRETIGDRPIYLCTVIPRSNTGNSTRVAANDWLASLPYGAAGLVDLDAVMRTGAGVDAAALPADLTCDTIHPSFKGSELMASALGSALPT
ncbi:SGNH/GDSL hydrolase family protein, partial [Nocardia gipuzkoensis]